MKPEIHAAWIADLRSGQHEQTEGALCDGTGFCCLGRLTELYIAANPGKMQFRHDLYSWTRLDGGTATERNKTPMPVAAWADLQSVLGDIDNDDIPSSSDDDAVGSLADLNDAGLSFPDIADVIEYLGADYF